MTSTADGHGRLGRVLVAEGDDWVEWKFAKGDRPLRERIAAWGACGLGGFTESGDDDEGGWIRRPRFNVDTQLKKSDRFVGARAVTLSLRLAEALAASEEAALAIGPFSARDVHMDRLGRAHLLIDRTLHGLVGADVARSEGISVDPAWLPPEQADGAAWDAEANRYVLGLILYRAISGGLPFSGAGIRHALHASHERRTAAPFAAKVAAGLAPGLQTLVLSLLSPVRNERPRSSREIIAACADTVRGSNATPLVNASSPRVLWKHVSPVPRRTALQAWTIALVVPLMTAAWDSASPAGGPSRVVAPASRPLARIDSGTCTSCHWEEARQWQQSVMAFASKSPLFGALESAIEEQIGRSDACPNGAGVLRSTEAGVCRDPSSGIALTGTGGERWCVNCHAPGDNLEPSRTGWNEASATRRPVSELLSREGLRGVSCLACHTASHPASPGSTFVGNPTWRSPLSGAEFFARPENRLGKFGIGNSGYVLEQEAFFGRSGERVGEPIVHQRSSGAALDYLRTSEFCGGCHDVRLFGTDVLSAPRGEHFKRLRNAYSEWRSWAEDEKRAGREPASCQGCHMSLYPGVCEPGGNGEQRGCPKGTHFVARAPGSRPASGKASHYFTSVDLPLSEDFDESAADSSELDGDGVPVGLRARRNMLLKSALTMSLGGISSNGTELRIPVTIENVGAGHRVPAGFSQEREVWVELVVVDARGALVYEAGRISRDDEDLHDKRFLSVTTGGTNADRAGRPLGMFGADVADDADVPAWSGDAQSGWFGSGLINLQNGFLRCVQCIGRIDASGRCQPSSSEQAATRAARFSDGDYDIDTGQCRSNLRGNAALFETYFPIGALDAARGAVRGPDAIIDTRSAAPGVPLRYVVRIPSAGHPSPFRVTARLRFRAFPPFLVRAFSEYERAQEVAGERPSGAQVTDKMLARIDVVDLATATAVGP